MLTTCSWVKGFAAVVAPPWRVAYRRGGGTCPDPIGTPPWRGKLAATSARAGLKPDATALCCAQAGRTKTNPVARMRNVGVLRNLMATSRAVRGLREIDGGIIPKLDKRGVNALRSAAPRIWGPGFFPCKSPNRRVATPCAQVFTAGDVKKRCQVPGVRCQEGQDAGFGTRDTGYGIRDSGLGIRGWRATNSKRCLEISVAELPRRQNQCRRCPDLEQVLIARYEATRFRGEQAFEEFHVIRVAARYTCYRPRMH